MRDMSPAESPGLVSSLFETNGVEQLVAGNTPFLLSGADTVWLVVEGRVDVFFVAVEDGRPRGARHHYLMAGPGDLLFGMDLERYGADQGFLAVGVVGTRLRRMGVRWLRTADMLHVGLPDLLDRWVSALSSGSSRNIIGRPRADVLLEAPARVAIGDGRRVRASGGVVWVRHDEGQSLFLGMEETAEPRDAFFPVTADTWLQALGPVTLTAVHTAEALGSRDAAWRGLEAFYRTLFQCEYFNTRLIAADELNRLKEKTERDGRITRGALSSLATVLAPRAHLAPAVVDDPLLEACRLVGQRLGIDMKAPPKPREDELAADDPVRKIARASNVRVRQVVLKGHWWRYDTPPFVGFFAQGSRPVAMLPRAGRMMLHEPGGGEPTRVTARTAKALAPTAYAFYPSFPDKPLTPWDIFSFGARLEKRDFLTTVLVGLGAGILALLAPVFLGLLVDRVVPEASYDDLLMLAVILTAVGVTTTLLDTVRALGAARLEILLSGTVQPAMWDRLLKMPASFFRRFMSGDLAERVSYVDAIRKILTGATIDSLMTGVFSVFLFVLLFYYSWRLALVATVLVALALAATIFAVTMKLPLQRSVIRLEGQIAGLVLQLFTGIAKLRVTGAEGRAFGEWAQAFAALKRLELRTGRIDARLEVFNSMFPLLSTICLFAVMATMSGRGVAGAEALSTGDFVAFNAAFGTFIAETQRLAVALLSMLSVVPLFERAKPILETRPEVDASKADPGELSGLIEVDHVSFRYQATGPLVLDDVSLTVQPGEFVAIVGPSGSGKSTLLRVLLGLESPETGSVFYDGRDLEMLDVQKLRRRIGVVMQNARIRAGTIFENIVGAGRFTLEDAWLAARMAGLEEDIAAWPMGMHTVLQQGGTTLSGGQRQRLIIARAIIARPRVLLFDEATSALDNQTQAVVSQSLRSLQATRIAIAHRLSTIMQADRVYVMQRGAIAQVGTYAELMAQPGAFVDLARRHLL